MPLPFRQKPKEDEPLSSCVSKTGSRIRDEINDFLASTDIGAYAPKPLTKSISNYCGDSTIRTQLKVAMELEIASISLRKRFRSSIYVR